MKDRQIVTHVGVADGRVRYSSEDLDNQIHRFKYDKDQKWFTLPSPMTRMAACELLLESENAELTKLNESDIAIINKALSYHYIRFKTKLNKEIKNGKN